MSNNNNEEMRRKALELHESYRGKIATQIKIPVRGLADLALAYSPGVAEPCRKIAATASDVFRYTNRGNTVAVVSDGSAVLGLGNIGPEAALPVMEGKALLFQHFAQIDAVPLCLGTQEPERIVEICCALEANFGGINLEDIHSPNCVIVERELEKRLRIPVFHDDQHGTAIVCAAALRNAARLTGRQLQDMRVVVCGMGAAGAAIARMLKQLGVGSILGFDKSGILRPEGQHNFVIRELFEQGVLGQVAAANLGDLLCGADAFIGVSAPALLNQEMVRSMAKDSIVLAMANPDPEIAPEQARQAGAVIVGTGRMDYPNQINNVLAFPGIFHGVLRAQQERVCRGLATYINAEMKLAAVEALAGILQADELSCDCILPSPMDARVVPQVSEAVYQVARNLP